MIRRLIRLLRAGRAPKTLQEHHTCALSSHRRTEAAIMEMSRGVPPGGCCPACMYGDAYTALCEQSDRQSAWIAEMERKMGVIQRLPEQRLSPTEEPAAECPECDGHAESTYKEPGRLGAMTFRCMRCGHEWTDEPDYEPDEDGPSERT